MKRPAKQFSLKTLFASIVFLLYQSVALAQDAAPKVEVNNTDVGIWIGNNWIWAVAVIVFLLILLFSGGSRATKVTRTTIQKSDGRTIKTTTTETE